MKKHWFSEARQKFSALLEQAERDGEVRIVRKNGAVFVILPEKRKKSPFDVPGIDININRDEIVDIVREGRERGDPDRSA